MTVVIVEDDDGLRDSLQMLLSSNGYPTRTYASAEAFLAAADDAACAFLLVDQHLDGMSGTDLLRHLGAAAPLPPAVLVSARLTASLAAEATAAGAMRALEKPLAPGALLALIADSTGPVPTR